MSKSTKSKSTKSQAIENNDVELPGATVEKRYMDGEKFIEAYPSEGVISTALLQPSNETEGVITETQEQALQTVEPEVTPYSDEDLASLKALANSENAPESFFEERQQDVIDGRLTAQQFADILGVEYEAPIPGMGHNNPPEDTEETEAPDTPVPSDPVAAQVAEELKTYKPKDATNSAEATERVRDAMNAFVEHDDDGETSLTSKCAIAIADWLAFNAGLMTAGNRVVAVSKDMYRVTLDNMGSFVDSETKASDSFKTRVGQMIKRAILIMDGKLEVGYFTLPGDRRRVSAADEASLTFPNDVPEGARVKRAVVIRDGLLVPTIINRHPKTGEEVGRHDNSEAKELRLVNNVAVNALFDSLWDKDGEIQYHPIGGHIFGFKSGKTLAEEEAKAKAQLEKEKAEANKEQSASRQTGGTQKEDNAAATVEQLKTDLAQAREDASAAVEAGKGDILSALNGLGAYIRDTSQPMPEQARVTFWKDANAMFARRLIGPNVKPSKDEMRELCKLIHNLDNHLKWDDQRGIWSFSNVDGHIVTEFGLDQDDKAA